jgi:hypothetical protein
LEAVEVALRRMLAGEAVKLAICPGLAAPRPS